MLDTKPIRVAVNEQGPAIFAVHQHEVEGEIVALPMDDCYVTECVEAAWEALLEEGRRLPAGSVEVLVCADEWRKYAAPARVGAAVARRVA